MDDYEHVEGMELWCKNFNVTMCFSRFGATCYNCTEYIFRKWLFAVWIQQLMVLYTYSVLYRLGCVGHIWEFKCVIFALIIGLI